MNRPIPLLFEAPVCKVLYARRNTIDGCIEGFRQWGTKEDFTVRFPESAEIPAQGMTGLWEVAYGRIAWIGHARDLLVAQHLCAERRQVDPVEVDLRSLTLGPVGIDRLDMHAFVELEARTLEILHELAVLVPIGERDRPAENGLPTEEVPE